ncbi:MAG: DUF996 domain-containing protein [Bacteroidetes bacterium]|nr:MAG: DUF996 domain-containing protein [Bacteroidota bacterium]TAG90708.1 MAG: DUF996 domain-containing protein [Bacteroidota bacterium]
MKPVLFARIGFLSSIALSFVIDGNSVIGFILAVLPQLLIVAAFYMFAKSYQKTSIFINYVISFACSLVMNIVIIFTVKKGGTYLMQKFGNSNEKASDMTAFLEDLTKKAQSDPEFAQEIIKSFLTTEFIGLTSAVGILFIFVVLFSSFSYKALGKVTGVKNLVLASTLLLVSLPTLIIFGLGFLLMLVAIILVIISMFQLDEKLVSEGKNHTNPMM